MMDSFRGGAIAMLVPVTTGLGRFQSFTDTHLVAVACAVMFASAVALPSFSSSALGLKGLYEFTLGLFLSSAVSFGLMHRREIKENIAHGLLVCLPFALTALLVIRPTPRDFAAHVPVSGAISIMIIIYVVPMMRKFFRDRNVPQDYRLGEMVRADHRTQPSGSDAASVGSNSTRSSGLSLWIWSLMASGPNPMAFNHLDHAEEYNTTATPPYYEMLSPSDLGMGLQSGSSQTSAILEDFTDPSLF